jgi:Concanavalin A-like lectin/glucanases superfamily/Malectin domain/Domain of unknown function (DUF1929)/Bacterial Ig domain/Bacterial Ig-like domain
VLSVFVATTVLLLGGARAATQPAAPTGVTGIALDGRVELAWQPVSGADHYSVYRGTSPGAITTLVTPAGGVTATSFVDTTAANGTAYYYVARAIAAGTESTSSVTVQSIPVPRACSTGNAVVLENCYPGTTSWKLTSTPTVAAGGIEGFASAQSINHGESVDLKVNTTAGAAYNAYVYRTGYYGGSGARLYSTLIGLQGTAQPACSSAANTTGLYDCANWSVSATITTTASWPSGVYLVRLVRTSNNAENHILVVVRDDSRPSDVLFGVPFSTYEAYNPYGGKSLYPFNSSGATTVAGNQEAVKVSFDRPFEYARIGGTHDWYTRSDYPFVFWLERNGYDVAYQSDTDMELNGARVKNHKAYILGAHDEYYSAAMRTALEQARDAGTSLFDTGANAVYWKIRFENGPTGGQNRVEVCYKTTATGAQDPGGITSTWRDPAGANKPENGLLGVMYVGDNSTNFFPFTVRAADGTDSVYRKTSLQNQAPGTSTSIGTSVVGWEWDARVANGAEPAGTKTLSATPVSGNLIQNNGANTTTGTTTSNAAKYTAASGALVFATGTNQWVLGLGLNAESVGEPDFRIQQTTMNVLEDMGAAAATPAPYISINSGGGPYTASDTNIFDADEDFTGGATNSTAHAITGTPNPALYQTERWGSFSYAIPVPNGTYNVRLHFVELYYAAPCVGKRIFSMDITDTAANPDIANLDICAAAGGANAALVRTVNNVTVSDGVLNIRSIYGSADDPEVAAIEVIPATGPPPPPPPLSVTGTNPDNGATGIAPSTSIRATFSRPMDASTITGSSFTLKRSSDGTAVAASVAYDGSSNTATLTPTTALASTTGYTARLDTTIKSSDGTPLPSAYSWSFTTGTPAVPGAVRVNTGGPAYTASGGSTFLADQFFSGGSTFSTNHAITGTTDQSLYQNERWGNFSYAIPVNNGTYDVKLHFVELYYGTSVPGGAGKRIFSMDILDTPMSPDLKNIDIYADVGANAADVKTISGVTVTDGVLNIQSAYGAADDPEIAAIEVIPSSGPPPPPPPPPPPLDQTGQWSTPFAWPGVAVHMSLLTTGNVLSWDGFDAGPNSEQIWNPTTSSFTPIPYGRNLFCAGHVTLADGRTFIAGGHITADVGLADTTIFDPTTNTWTREPDMTVGRWYPTATELADGRVLVFSGDNIVQNRSGQPPPLTDASVNSLPEVYDPTTNKWTDLDAARLTSPLYPFMFVLSSGKVLDAGPDLTTRVLDTASSTWTTIGSSPFDGMSAVMYRPDKIMKSGSWADPDFNGALSYNTGKRTAVLDMTQPSPAWRETAPMNFPRGYHNLTLLPDGTVLASGGMTTSDGTDLSKAVLPAEIWNPDTETWTTVASLSNGREYHSTALLLPDGRVLMAGGGQLPGSPAINEDNAEIYSPPYMFKGTRPSISAAPSVVQYGSSFTVTTPDAANIGSVSLIRTPSVTHAFDQNQRFQWLSFTKGSGSLTVQAPTNANAPPGYYMLSIVNTNGVPSVSKFIRFPAASEDTQPPTAPSNLTATGGLGTVSLSWTAATDNVGIAKYSVYRSTTSGFTPDVTNRIGQTSSVSYTDGSLSTGTYYYRVKAEDAVGNLSPASNEANATVTGDTTAPSVSITTPTNGATVSGSITVSANASDNTAVAGVQFKVDGGILGSEDTSSPYSLTWDTATVANGSHTLTAVARDTSNNLTTSAPVQVTTNNTASPSGLVLSFNFNQGSGTTVPDGAGKGNTGTLTNTTWSATGKYGGSLSFNGSSSWVTVADNATLDLTNAMTLEGWVNPTATGTTWRTVLIKQNTGALVYSLYANTDTQRPSGHVFTSTEFDTRGTAAVPLNAWTFLAVTYDGATLRMYVNGTQVSSKPVSGSMPNSTGVLRIGGNSVWGEYFAGLIDNVRVYNRALSASELQTDMNTPVP